MEIQPLRKTTLTPQRKKCRANGHTQKYYYKYPRCIKCAGKHLTMDCKKLKNAQPKCVNCGEP